TLIVWDLKTRKPRHRLPGHFSTPLSVVYSPDGKVLATGDGSGYSSDFDAQVRLWDLSTGRLLRQISGHLNLVSSLTFSPPGSRLASGGHDARTRVWDVSTGKRLLEIRGESIWHRSVAFSPDGKTLLAAASGELELRRADSGQKVRDLGRPGDERRMIPFTAF